MAEPAADPGVTAPPAEPVAEPKAPATPAPAEPSSGTEPVIKSGDKPEQTVPFTRFQEVNDKAKTAEEEAQTLREENEQLKANQQSTPQADDELDPDVEDLIRKGAKKLGLVSQDELDAQTSQAQVRMDIATLEANPPNPGIAFDGKAVREYAETNNLPITSKAAFVAAYREMNYDKILEAERNRAVDAYKTSGSAGAEKPGSQGAQPPGESEVSGSNPKERTRSRISAARQKLQV